MTSSIFKQKKRIVIKIGSALLIDDANTLQSKWLKNLLADVVALQNQGKDIVIVSSGSVALGCAKLNLSKNDISLPIKQAAASVGQIALAHAYQTFLSEHEKISSQILLSLFDSENRRRYLNAKNTLETLLEMKVIPVVNENDTVATAEIRFGDNDRLAARVAQMIDADLLVLLSDIDGLYTQNPHIYKTAKHISEVENINSSIMEMAGESHTNFGSGGMKTKLEAAKMAIGNACDMLIAKGDIDHPLKALSKGAKYTIFKATITPKKAHKRWIEHHLNHFGEVVIDKGAVTALMSGKSLLAVGIVEYYGTFNKGDALTIKNLEGEHIATGLCNYSNIELEKIKGKKTKQIANILGYCSGQPIIHRNNLVLV